MRQLFNQDRALSHDVVNMALRWIAGLFLAAGGIGLIFAVMTIFSGAWLTGLFQIAALFGGLIALYLLVRLQVETLWALHRLNDRMSVLSDDLRPREPAPAAPARQKAAAKAAAKTPEKTEESA
ncbi:MAG: hypothetical protein AAFX03_02260 [Pseudomonadota bacterium]